VIGAFQKLTSVNATDASLGDGPLSQLRQIIANNSEPGLVAISRLQLARGLEARARDVADAPELRDAETQYKTILDLRGAPNHLKAAAAFRLGVLYETRREFAKARETYSSLSTNPTYRGSPFTELATTRLEQLDDLAVPIRFEPGVRPLATGQPTPQPADIPTAADVGGEEFMGPPAAPAGQTPAAPTTQPAAGGETPADAPPTTPSQPQQP
jgi:hypothetical protein